VLLSLLKEQQVLRDKLIKESKDRERIFQDLEKKLSEEIAERLESDNCLAENCSKKFEEQVCITRPDKIL
jgi:hypothetical protein